MKRAIALIALLLSGCASAAEISSDSSPMQTGQRVMPPTGFIGFCVRHVGDCTGGTDAPQTVILTPEKLLQLAMVNDSVNALPQVLDRGEHWDVAGSSGGDCEDLALAKRKMLIESGWPVSSLLLATAERWNGEFHAVLIVATDRGDLVLDNLNRAIVAWDETPYAWKKRQSEMRPFLWVSLDRSTFRSETNALPPIGEPAFVTSAIRTKD